MVRWLSRLAFVLWAASSAPGAENLVANGGFEEGLAGWQVTLRGDWASKADRSRIVGVTRDARTGGKALFVDTTALNPGAAITDELRTWRRPKYEILVTTKIAADPNAWYLLRLHVRSPGIAIHSGLEFLCDIQPWPLRTYGKSLAESHWKAIHAWEKRLFLPQAPRTDNAYHKHVLLKQTYPQTDALEVGVRIRAPWTGRIVLDDVAVTRVDPDRDMTPMARLLAMRAARPIEKVRELDRRTLLVDGGKAAAAILVPAGKEYRLLGERIRSRVRERTGAALPVVTKPGEVPPGRSIVAIGSMMVNDLVARLHFNRYVRVDAASPGPGGYVLWTVAEPYGRKPRQNVVVVAGSDMAGERAAVEAFCALLDAHAGRTIRLPYLHTVFPKRTIPPAERDVPRGTWGFHWDRNRLAGFSKWYVPRWLATGDLDAARLARKEILRVADSYLEAPYFQTAWDTYEVGWAWDAIEEAPVFSDADRRKITNVLLAYLHMRPQETSDWSRLVPDLAVQPTWNHQAKGLSGAYTMGRYFDRYYGRRDARCAYYLSSARNAFRQQARWSKPQENSGNYWLITMRFAISHYLGEWDKTFFDTGALRRYAEYFAHVCNNKGWIAGFGDTYYCYHGCAPRAISGTGIGDPSLALWHDRDGRILWWLRHGGFERYRDLYHPDLEPVEWKELLGVKRVPLERGLFDTREKLPLWGSGGEGTDGPTGEVRYDETFDKIAFRSSWDPNGEYLLLEGNGRGIHSGRATNQICKLSLLGEDLLIGSCYRNNNIRTNDSLIVVKDARIDDPAVKGTSKWAFGRWRPLEATYPVYAAVEALADLPHAGFTRTALRGYQGTDWHRNVFWRKGEYFALIDEVVAREPGTYYVESNLKTCPAAQKSYPKLTPRTWDLLPGRRGVRQTFRTKPSPIDLFLLTDGTAAIVTEQVTHHYITARMVRQVRDRVRLAPGEKVTFINLFCGAPGGAKAAWRLDRLGPTEALIFRGAEPVAYFGCGQGERGRAVLPIRARMFLLTPQALAVVDATAAGPYLRSAEPVSRELAVPTRDARAILVKLAATR